MSEYIKTEWKNGDVITAEKLNHIEDGIAGGSGDFQIVGIAAGGTTTFNTIPKGLSIDDLVGAVINFVYKQSDDAADSMTNTIVVAATDVGDKILLTPGGANISYKYYPATGAITM